MASYYLLLYLFVDIKKIKQSEIIFFFPYYQTGGAERIHLNIVKSINNKKICIIFTNNSETKNFYKNFVNLTKVIEINKIITKRVDSINKIVKKSILKYLNSNEKLISVFGSNSKYYYELLPYIKSDIKKIDLIHAVSDEYKWVTRMYMASSCYLDARIVINKRARIDLLNHYKLNNINKILNNRVFTVQNSIEMDDVPYYEDMNSKIKIGYIGRWSPEKRPDIFLEIAKRIKKIKPSIDFEMVGIGMKSKLKRINKAGISYLGEVTDNRVLNGIYRSLTFILITSSREGFPVVIMEAMANGVIPITTDVGGINEHIKNGFNGFLIKNNNLNEIVEDFCKTIKILIVDKERTKLVSKNAFNYAHLNFRIDKFNKSYQKILLNK